MIIRAPDQDPVSEQELAVPGNVPDHLSQASFWAE